MELVLTGALAASLLGLCVVAARARMLRVRLQSLGRPLHELRGSLTALGLGLSGFERTAPWARWGDVERPPAMRGARTDGLALQLERATLALDDLDACREGIFRTDELGNPELVDLKALVLRGARAWSQLAPFYGTRVRAHWPERGVRVVGRAGRLAQALDNLIANAVEHGGGGVLVEGELAGSRVRVAVVDRGQGVSPSARIREAPARSKRGHGLAITRDVVAAHGGELLFERRGLGAAVVIELPIASPDATRISRRGTGSLSVQANSGAPRAA